ncbi:hypothetical protein [Saccharibacillus alkalitolerans]|uniref:ABC transporter permease n=1 Tax=Saccharibacillus alkalitolerans TaxID=2705290 RepID=A0ABX0EZ57_9BACL|nr:hypothetical protein [Saccharibacillus alkalitolerans]NGZ74018.1 hypothetical protein [Saccharibacillus alkalitolerans]
MKSHRNNRIRSSAPSTFDDIDYPDEREIRLHVASIVEKALPVRPSFPAYIGGMYRQLGFRHLFRDLTEIVFVLLLGLGILVFMALFMLENANADSLYAFIFIVSPLLYLAVSLIFFADLRRRDTYQVEMACRYNVYQLASLRMLTFSAVCLVLNAGFVCWIALTSGQVDLLRGLLLSASSLFAFAAAFLYGMLRGRTAAGRYATVGLWPLLNAGLWIAEPHGYRVLLSGVPIYAYLGLLLLGAAIYVGQARELIHFRPKLS